MANKSENADIREMQTQMGDLLKSFGEFKSETKDNFDKLITKLDALILLPSKLEDHEKRISKLEGRHATRSAVMMISLTASAIINIIVIYKLFTKG